MTRQEVLRLKPGRELDKLVQQILDFPLPQVTREMAVGAGVPEMEGRPIQGDCPSFSETWNGAGLVAERMAELGWNLELEVLVHSKRARIRFWRRAEGVYSSSGFTPPLPVPEAMCKAALIAELGLSGVTVSSV